MGLDVFLIYYPVLELRQKELEFLQRDNEIWEELSQGDNGTLSQQEKDVLFAPYGERISQVAAELGLKTRLDGHCGEGHETIVLDSVLYPTHLFKIGYFRSQAGGFNSICRRLIEKDLYWLFDPEESEDCISFPDWEAVTRRAKQFCKELETAIAKAVGEPYSGWCVQATEIILEACAYVLNSGEPEHYALEWL
jgi:hypothetical protein